MVVLRNTLVFSAFSFSFLFLFFILFLFSVARNLFFWPQLLHDFSLCSFKKSFFQPCRVVPALRPLCFFFSFCFLVFFFYKNTFCCFKNVFFSLCFLFFSFFLVFFLFFFDLFLYLFFFVASVSEFNCFLRSRCSMEMRCPDDTGWDSWDWVRPPALGRA